MSLPWEKKKTASHIVGRIGPDGQMAYGGKVKNEAEFGASDNLHSLAESCLAAIKSGSASGLAECFRTLKEHILAEDRVEDKAQEG